MKHILLLLILAVALAGCTTTDDLIERNEKAYKRAQECVNKGGSPYFFYGNGSYSELLSDGCVEKDSQLKQ